MKMKRCLSVFLVICLMASFVFCLPVQALAAEAESEGVALKGENKPNASASKVVLKDMLSNWSENGLPAPVEGFVAAFDVFVAATYSFAISVYRVLTFFGQIFMVNMA